MIDDNVRPEVVGAIMDAFLEGDPGRLPEDATPEEARRGWDGIGQHLIATRGDNARRAEVWAILAEHRFADRGMGWHALFNELDENEREQLWECLDVVPEPLAERLVQWDAGGR